MEIEIYRDCIKIITGGDPIDDDAVIWLKGILGIKEDVDLKKAIWTAPDGQLFLPRIMG